MRLLSKIGIQQYTNHEAFIIMLNACLRNNSKFELIDIIQYWFELAFSSQINEEDLNDDLIDRIRYQLLIKGGISKPILKESKRIERIKQSIVFE